MRNPNYHDVWTIIDLESSHLLCLAKFAKSFRHNWAPLQDHGDAHDTTWIIHDTTSNGVFLAVRPSAKTKKTAYNSSLGVDLSVLLMNREYFGKISSSAISKTQSVKFARCTGIYSITTEKLAHCERTHTRHGFCRGTAVYRIISYRRVAWFDVAHARFAPDGLHLV